jgi:poly-beta-1,6-N-acetyl-D-glucosamine synthase
LEYLLLFFFILSIAFPLLHIVHCLPFFKKKKRGLGNFAAEEKGISILVPCYNEQGIIQTSVHCMKELSYSKAEVIYINDGSTDETLNLLKSLLKLNPCTKLPLNKISHKTIRRCYQSELYPNIFVLDKVNGGKADALNAGIEYASMPLVVTLDADTILSNQALPSVNEAFEDKNVVAAGGMVHVLQTKVMKPLEGLSLRGANMLVRAQTLDFLKAFYVNKVSLARFQALAVISGAFGIFTRKAHSLM